MAVFTCHGAAWLNDLIDATLNTCGGWIGTATSTTAFDQSETDLKSPEIQARVCAGFAGQSQPTSISQQWIGTHTFGAGSCVGSAANFESTSTVGGNAGKIIVGGEFTKIPVLSSDSIQFTIVLTLT